MHSFTFPLKFVILVYSKLFIQKNIIFFLMYHHYIHFTKLIFPSLL